MSIDRYRSRSPVDLWYLSLITPLSSPIGQQIFARSFHCAFDRLHPYFEAQERNYFCGVACASILLNTLSSSPKWTQSTLYSTVAQAYMLHGITLTNLSNVLRKCGLSSIIRHCEDETIEEQFRRDIKNEQNFLIVNYWRQFEGNDKNYPLRYGHFSLVAAFDEITDQVLLLDTSNAKHPQHWLGVKQLIRMMSTFDRTATMSRGYLIVNHTKNNQTNDLNSNSTSIK
ncbi:unnamed protein product [Adineta steineri]|uniref:glutathione gamma-glutamylcysteinyltransferase n=1 Tax=Adineta steineri TaxID=433720 RepID=A0A814HK97_9BILA|nr:unnamed protein product [Adineta steineri]